MAEPEPSIHLPAPGLRNSRPAVMLLALGALFLLVAAAVLGMVLAKVWRDRGDWPWALPAGLLGAGLVGLIGYTAVRWGLAAAWCDVSIRLPPGRLVVERSRPKGYRLDVPVADVAGVHVADQFHPSVGWELLLVLEDLRVVRVVNGRTKKELETVAQRVRSHLGPRASRSRRSATLLGHSSGGTRFASLRTMEPFKPFEPMKPLPGMEPMRPMEPLPFIHPGIAGERPWWPGKLGTPEAAGGQGDVRYAYFRSERRLAVDRGGVITVYDTADHRIGGVSQQQGRGRSDLVFTSQHGPVPLDALRVVETMRADV